MTELIAIIRRSKTTATQQELARIGCAGYNRLPVLGRGRQRGLKTDGGRNGIALLPKMMFSVVVEDAQTQEAVEAIIRANQTGDFGDGKIFVIEVGEAYRVATGEVRDEARQSHHPA